MSSFGWSLGDIVCAIEVLYNVGKALKDAGKADEKYTEARLFLESLAATLESVRASDASVPIRHYVDLLKPHVEKFCQNLKKCFEDTLGNSSPKDWQEQLRTLQKRAIYALFDQVNVQELKDDISTPLQVIQINLNLQCFISLSALRSNLSALPHTDINDIERVIARLLIEYRSDNEKYQESSRIREVLEWVYPKGSRPMIDVHEDFCDSLLEGSCEWLFDTEQYCRWLNDVKPSLLWITGKPGAGKTSLATRVIQRLESSTEITLAYYFCDTNDSARCEFLNILQSWVWQFLSQDKSKIDEVASVRNRGVPPGEVSMRECLDHLLSNSDGQKRVILLDGLDECPLKVRRQLCKRLVRLADQVKVLLFSRTLEDISFELRAGIAKAGAKAKFEHFHISSGDTADDLTNFLETSVKNKFSFLTQDLKIEIINSLRAGADGMFQWAALMIQNLAQPWIMFEDQYLKVLQDLPRGIDALYGRILDGLCNSDNSELSQKLLQWIVCSRRPLTLEEVGEVLIFYLSRTKRKLIPDLSQAVRELCGTLVEVKDMEKTGSQENIERCRVVALIHSSAKDFLLNQSRKSESFGALLVDSGEAHAQIARACLATICDEKAGFLPLLTVSEQQIMVSSHEGKIWKGFTLRHMLQRRVDDYLNGSCLMKYAVMNWLSHLTSAKESALLCHYVKALYTSRENTIRWLQLCLCIHRQQAGSGFSAILEDMRRLPALRKALGEDQVAVRAFEDCLAHLQGSKNSRFTRWHFFLNGTKVFDFLPPIHIAAYFDFDDFVKEYLKRGGDVNFRTFSGLSPLCLAARGDSVRSAEVLLEGGAEMNSWGFSASPLHLAIKPATLGNQGPSGVGRLLLEKGADAYSTTEYIRNVGKSILLSACREQFSPNDPSTVELVRMLLVNGAKRNLESVSIYGHEGPLQCAVRRDSAALVDLLLRNGANCESRCSIVDHVCYIGHKTALLLACSREYICMDVIRKLLVAGASVKAKCHDGRTALHMAAAHPVELAKLLLEFDAEVNEVSADGSLAIHEAVRENNIPVLQALVDNGSLLDAKDEKGLSPLAMALEEGFDDAIELLRARLGDAGAEAEIAARPTRTNSLLHEPEPGYWPRDKNDQFSAFRLLRRPGIDVKLPTHIVCRILDLAEYWVKSIVSRNEAKQVYFHIGKPTPKAYLQTARIPGRDENPVQKVRFVIRSHDQGWSAYPGDHGSFANSWTWFDIQIVRRSGRSVDFGEYESKLLTRNVHAKLETTEFDIVYGNGPGYRKCNWIHWLKPGDQLGISAMASFPGDQLGISAIASFPGDQWRIKAMRFFPGCVNHIEFAQIEVFCTFLPREPSKHSQGGLAQQT